MVSTIQKLSEGTAASDDGNGKIGLLAKNASRKEERLACWQRIWSGRKKEVSKARDLNSNIKNNVVFAHTAVENTSSKTKRMRI
jgi:hypothetical protein